MSATDWRMWLVKKRGLWILSIQLCRHFHTCLVLHIVIWNDPFFFAANLTFLRISANSSLGHAFGRVTYQPYQTLFQYSTSSSTYSWKCVWSLRWDVNMLAQWTMSSEWLSSRVCDVYATFFNIKPVFCCLIHYCMAWLPQALLYLSSIHYCRSLSVRFVIIIIIIRTSVFKWTANACPLHQCRVWDWFESTSTPAEF